MLFPCAVACGSSTTSSATDSGASAGVDAADASQPADTGTDAGSTTMDAASLLPFLSPCMTNDQCETQLCYLFNMRGKLCSKACNLPADCPAPSTGCNGMGICKAP